MRIHVLSAALMVAAFPAFAQSAGSVAANSDSATAVVFGGGAGGSGGSTEMHESGHLYSTPSVGGSYSAFVNPCGLSSGGAGAGGPIGLSFSVGYEGANCVAEHQSLGFASLYQDRLGSLARWCQRDANADAYFAAHGGPCIGRSTEVRYFVNGHEISATDTLRLASAIVGAPMVTLSNTLPAAYAATQRR